ncbi:DUF202 domain-containing protein [Acidimicrobiaceae bacterium AH-315-P05]|nr:DUF202 domain-containing protein [Acidimicrobiaceae bacterium AH-315-P05]
MNGPRVRPRSLPRPRVRVRPWGQVIDNGLQHERTALAWERTAISMMVMGVLVTRFASQEEVWIIAAGGLVQTIAAAAFLVWTGQHYEELHGRLTDGTNIIHPTATRFIGTMTVVFIGVAFALAVVSSIS